MKIFRFFVEFTLICFALSQTVRAVVPPPDGGYPNLTTAEGQNALYSLTTGAGNTALGAYSLFSTTNAGFNTAVGAGALLFNSGDPTSSGAASQNTAFGAVALLSNTQGSRNTAIGFNALPNDQTGNDNIIIGAGAGQNLTTGSGNIYIGASLGGAVDENGITRIKNVYESGASERAVYINSSHKLGTLSSSRRYKDEIRSMAKASDGLLSLRPVTFRYKKEIDPARRLSFGLVAEEVAQVDPDLVTRDRDGKPETVRYEAVNAMLLNEFLKEHQKSEEQQCKLQEQEGMIARQQKQIDALTAGLQKVNAQLEASKLAPQVAAINQ